MTTAPVWTVDPKRDLVLERIIDVPPALVWKVWTTPEHLKHWFVPKPWTITDCEVDLRPGGVFRSVIQSPKSQEFPNIGCYLEIRSEEHTSELQSLMRISYAVFCLKKKKLTNLSHYFCYVDDKLVSPDTLHNS